MRGALPVLGLARKPRVIVSLKAASEHARNGRRKRPRLCCFRRRVPQARCCFGRGLCGVCREILQQKAGGRGCLQLQSKGNSPASPPVLWLCLGCPGASQQVVPRPPEPSRRGALALGHSGYPALPGARGTPRPGKLWESRTNGQTKPQTAAK